MVMVFSFSLPDTTKGHISSVCSSQVLLSKSGKLSRFSNLSLTLSYILLITVELSEERLLHTV